MVTQYNYIVEAADFTKFYYSNNFKMYANETVVRYRRAGICILAEQ